MGFSFFLQPSARHFIQRILPFFLIAFGIFWVIIGKGFWLREFWYDEVFTGLIIQLPWGEMFDELVSDVHPPLYYFLLKLWGGLFGFSDIALRSFSVLCFGGFLASLYTLIFEEVKRHYFAAGAVLFFIFNPFFAQYAQEARMYMLLCFLIMSAALFFFRALKYSPYRFDQNWLLFSFFLAPALVTHYTALFIVPAFFITGGLSLRAPQNTFSYLRSFVLATIFPTLLFLIWFPFFRQQLVTTTDAYWIISLRTEEIPVYLYSFFFGTEQGTEEIPLPRLFFGDFQPKFIGLALGVIIFFLARLFTPHEVGETKRFFLFCSQFAALMFGIFIVLELFDRHLILSRYLLPTVAFFLIACLILFSRLPKPFPSLLLLVYILLTFALRPAFEMRHYRELTKFLQDKELTQVVFINPMDFFNATFYNRTESKYLFYIGENDRNYSSWALFRRLPLLSNDTLFPEGSVLVVEGDAPKEILVSKELGSAGEFRVFEIATTSRP